MVLATNNIIKTIKNVYNKEKRNRIAKQIQTQTNCEAKYVINKLEYILLF